MLEESLFDFPGALVLVSHDRHLVHRVTTEILALDGKGGAQHFADYEQWQTHHRDGGAPKKSKPAARRTASPPKAKRLSYLEKREWEGMEETILTAEARVIEERSRTEDPAIATDADLLEERLQDLAEAQQEVNRLYARWAELEAKLS